MWRSSPPLPDVGEWPSATTTGHGSAGRVRGRSRRSRDRERLRLVMGLRSVSRRAGTSGRARRFEVLLCERAAAVRSGLLEVAAALERVADPDPRTLSTLRWLLTDGCSSPLLNPAVPGADLPRVLDLVRSELEGLDPSTKQPIWVEPAGAGRAAGTRTRGDGGGPPLGV